MTRNIYDQPDFFAAYSQLPRSISGLDGAPEWPSLQAMLPDLAGRAVVDLGCGFGWFCRWARAQGAASVLGIDLSEKMLAQAAAAPADGITYRKADIARLDLPQASFDLAYSSLALHYLADVAPLLRTLHRALLPGGHFVFSTEHPIYTASECPGWSVDPQGRKTWPVHRYFIEGARTSHWLTDNVRKYHRTIGTTLTTLLQSGFSIQHVEEFRPTDAQIAAQPQLAEELERPMFLLVSARR